MIIGVNLPDSRGFNMKSLMFMHALALAWSCCLAEVSLTPTISTTLGPLRGEALTVGDVELHRYQGIPFARPPVGELRFAPPQPAEPWIDTLEAVDYGNRCIQDPEMDMITFFPPREPPPTSEDCLYLTVVVPKTEGVKAVMVHIHGGGLFLGSSADISTDAMAIAGDVIHVAINYRLNIFGFLASEDDSAPGNVGFLDQVMALRWIKENVAAFGGDPERITIHGCSAGGWSVGAHMVSPLSEGLFNRAISQSGNLYGYNLESRTERARRNYQWAEELGCPTDNDSAILACFRKKEPMELVGVSNMAYIMEMNSPAVYGDSFLPKTVTELYDAHQVHAGVDYIIGTVSDEGGMILPQVKPMEDEELVAELLQNGIAMDDPAVEAALDFLVFQMNIAKSPSQQVVAKKLIKNLYMPDFENKLSNLRGLIDMCTDTWFAAPSIGAARRTAEAGNNVYHYWFAQAPTEPFDPILPQFQTLAAPELEYGAIHGMDCFYTYAHGVVGGLPDPFIEEEKMLAPDKAVSKSIVHSWTTFAKTGKVEYLSEDGEVIDWPAFDEMTGTYLNWKHPMTSSSLKSRLRPGRADFWNTLLPATMKSIDSEEEQYPENTPSTEDVQQKQEL